MEDLTFPYSSIVTEKPGFLDLILFVLSLKQLRLLKMFIKNVWARIKSFGLVYSLFSACAGISTLGQEAILPQSWEEANVYKVQNKV